MTQELIKVTTADEGAQVVSARDLYTTLEVKSTYRFSKWFENNAKQLIEGEDYRGVTTVTPQNQHGGDQAINDYVLTLDSAKQLAMMSGTEKGKEVRMYFIQVEKQFNSKEMVMARALQYSQQQMLAYDETIKSLNQVIEIQAPKVDYYEAVIASDNTLTATQIATDYGMSTIKFNKLLHKIGIQYKVNGQWVLYSGLTDKGYTESATGTTEYGSAWAVTKWTQKGKEFLYNTLKEQGIYTSRDGVAMDVAKGLASQF